MNIGIDVDGVLSDVLDFQLKIGAAYFKKKYGYDVINPHVYDVKDIFGCTEKERQKFGWERAVWSYMVCYPAIENASRVIRTLRAEGHKIYIITGRVKVTERGFVGWLSRFILTNWLKRRKIPYDEIFFCDEHHSVRDKTFGCEKYGVDVMVEDKPDNIMALSKLIKIVCFDAAYNRDCAGGNIFRARGWNEVYSLVKGIGE
jgi:uncharacterized HAD superfamily protein